MSRITTTILFTILFACCHTTLAQRAAILNFRETSWNFGDITEAGGAVDHEFVFTNSFGRSLKIAEVETSCGCTSPSWTRDAVPAGGTGKIVVRYDPKGRPGYFSKTISVTTEPPTGTYQLVIRGSVTEKKPEKHDDLEHVQGHLRSSASVLAFGKVYLNKDAVQKSFDLQNSGAVAMRFVKYSAPAHIRITLPSVLKPGERGTLTVRYDGGKRGTYGLATDQITLSTNDETEPEKHFQIMASLEEFFEPVPAERLNDVPRLLIPEASLNLGELEAGTTTERQLTLSNPGKQDLFIRAVVPNCTCLTVDGLAEKILPGSSLTLTVKFAAGERTGRQLKALMFYSTDPVKPVQRITVSAQLP